MEINKKQAVFDYLKRQASLKQKVRFFMLLKAVKENSQHARVFEFWKNETMIRLV